MLGETIDWRRLAVVGIGGVAIAFGAGLGTRSGTLSGDKLVALGGVLALTVFFLVLGQRMA